MKKLLAILLAVMLTFSLLAVSAEGELKPMPAVEKEKIKVGIVLIGPKDDGFSGAHYLAMERMKKEIGLTDEQVLYKFNVMETSECEQALVELVAAGCNIIYGNSWGYMNYMEEQAEEHPEVIFSHCSGYKSNGKNFNNYFGRIYQARYLAGIAAGLKTKENKLGYVGAFPDNAEVAGGINAFALGAQSVNPDAKVYVKYIMSWGKPDLEKQAAQALLDLGCDVIAQHVDSTMAQVAAQEAGRFGCGYNRDMTEAAPDAHLTAPIWNWDAIYTSDIQKLIKGEWTAENYFLGLKEGLVDISPLSKNVAEGTKEKIEAARKNMIENGFNVFEGPLYDNTDKLVLKEGEKLEDKDIVSGIMTNLLVKGVEVK